jgi:hypothetical protein
VHSNGNHGTEQCAVEQCPVETRVELLHHLVKVVFLVEVTKS